MEGVTLPDFRGQQRKGFLEEGIILSLSQGGAKGRKRSNIAGRMKSTCREVSN